jgi:hypothetical protein
VRSWFIGYFVISYQLVDLGLVLSQQAIREAPRNGANRCPRQIFKLTDHIDVGPRYLPTSGTTISAVSPHDFLT